MIQPVALTGGGRRPQSGKAAMLARAAAAGINVPAGVVIGPDDVEIRPVDLSAFEGLSAPLAVRSSFDSEDGMKTSAAGRFHSELHVPVEGLAAAIGRVRNSADATVGRADVLVMTQVAARHAGVAVLEDAYLDDLVEVTDGLADKLVGGSIEGERLLLPRMDRHLGAGGGWQGRLARVLREVRSEFGNSPSAGWDVEWADDGTVCWLVQIRPLLRPTLRNEALTLANHAEILPDLPSDFMTSVIIECGPRLLGWYTSLDARLPTGRDLMVERAGRPLLNAALLQDILRTWGLPTSLLADSMGGTADATPLSMARMVRSLPALLRVAARQLRSVSDAADRGQELLGSAREQELAPGGEESVTPAVDAAVSVYSGLVTGMFALANAHAVQVSVLRRLGLLDEVQRRSPTPAGTLARDLEAGVDLDRLLARHGHRGVYESDLARPRYEERPAWLERAREAAASSRRTMVEPARTVAGTLALPLWWSARRSLAARERLRDEGMQAFAVVRRRLLGAAEQTLDDPETVWLLTTDEARSLDEGWTPDDAFVEARRARRAQRAEIHVPDPIGRTDPITGRPDDDGDGPLAGRVLVGGSPTGTAWVCTEPPEGPPPMSGPVVLVARAIDGGWATAFSQVDGVVLHLGGDLSHGALILREMGVPTLTGVVDVQRRINTGDQVRIDGSTGMLHVSDRRAVRS